MTTICEIDGGVCGFKTTVEVKKTDNRSVSLKITTDCPNIRKLADELVELVPFEEIFKRAIQTRTYELASKYSPHPACIVPSGILKAVEVEAGLALPRPAAIRFVS